VSSAQDPAAAGGFLRTPHGTGRDKGSPGPRVEVHAPDELPAALPDLGAAERRRIERRPGGQFTREGAAQAGRIGGNRSGRPSLACSLGLSGEYVPSAQAFDPYRRRAASYRRAHCAELANLAGGVCGTGPSALVAQAALNLAMSRYLFDVATQGEGPPDTALVREARQQGDSARQNLLAAFELAVREGRARGTGKPGHYDPDAVTRRAEEEAEGKARARRARLPEQRPIDTTGEDV
jgi:hypothetical protein